MTQNHILSQAVNKLLTGLVGPELVGVAAVVPWLVHRVTASGLKGMLLFWQAASGLIGPVVYLSEKVSSKNQPAKQQCHSAPCNEQALEHSGVVVEALTLSYNPTSYHP